MAKKIEELIVELGIKGLEGLDNLSSSFRNLQKAIGPSDNAITQVRKSILDMSSAGKQSIQMIQGQIDAFKGLQTQATIGSNVYKQLAGDVNRLSDTLKKLKGDYEEVGRVAKQTDAQIANQFPARKPEAFRVQIAALNRELSKLSVSARAYGDALTQITIRETAFGRAQARQGAIAGAQAVGAPLIAAMTPQQALPNTTAALRVQLAELTQDFDNLDRSGEQYAETARQISRIQEELAQNILGVATAYDRHAAAENAAIRRAEKMRGIQEYYRGRGAASGFRDPNTGAIIAGGAPGTSRPLQQGPAAPPPRSSALFQSIADIGLTGVARDIEMMGRSYSEVEGTIRKVSAASDRSIASLQAQRSAWQQLRTQLDPASAGFKKTGREIELLDRRLEKLQVRQRRGLGPMGATQAAGAVISGGIFGGPEGAIGGAIGTAVGGVPGAFAGAAIGAQVGIMRQSLGTMASFTAEIDKQRIALRNVVGSQSEYTSSLQFIDQTSRRLAIPQDQLNKQFTQLSASVIGAGGNVDAAKIAFNGIAAGIRGTGGSLADMQSAMLATSQVFSKGKVSAEELRQQIGERLPGAFTLFAESIGKTPQELDKMLEKGEVGLNDFMTFVQALSQRYGSSAAEIAASSQAAGDRMQVTFARLREAIGRELQPVGAQFQEIFANFFEENEQAIVDFAKSLAGAIKVFADNAGLIAGVLKTLLGFGAIAGTAVVFAQVATGVATLSAAIVQLGGVAGVASLAMQTLSVSMAAIPVIGWIGAAIAGLALLGKAVYDTNDTFRNFVDNIGGVIASDFKNSVDGMAADASTAASNIQTAYEDLTAKLDPIGDFIKQLFKDVFKDTSDSAEKSATASSNAFDKFFSGLSASAAAGFNGLNTIISNWWSGLPAPIRSIFEGNSASLLIGAGKYAASLGSRAAAPNAQKTGMYGKYIPGSAQVEITPASKPKPGLGAASPLADDAARKQAADKAARDAAALAAEQQRLAEATAQAQIRLAETVFRAQTDFDRKRYDLQQELINKERELRVAALTGVASQAAASTAQFFRTVDELQRRKVEAGAGIIGAQRGLGNAQFMQSVTGASAGAPSIAGFTPQQLTSATKAAAKFTGVANMCSESVKAFYGSLGISLPGVTAWADTVRKAGTVMRDWSKLAPGDIVATGRPGDTPHVGVYTGGNNVFHQSRGRGLKAGNFPDLDYFKRQGYFVRPGAVAGRQPTGVAAQMRRNTADQGDVAIAQVDYDMAVKYKALLEEMVQKRLPQEVQLFALEGAKAYNEQTKALRDNVAELQARQSLEFSGASQETIDGELKKLQVTRDYTAQVNELKHQLTQKEALENPTKAEGLRNAIAAITQGYTDQKAAIDELTRAQIAYNEAQKDPGVILRAAATQARTDMSSLVNVGNQVVGAANAIGSSFGTAFKGLVSGSMSAKEALASFFQSTADYFLDMASKIITQWITMTILNSVLKLFPGGSGAAGIAGGGLAGSSLPGGFANPLVGAYTNANGNAFAANGIVPYAKGGIVNSPTLFKFAKGGAMQTGIMGEAGAEAVMPLKRGPDGKLGVAATGGGGVNVVVNVDAKGSAVQGDQGQGNELGRAIAGAVQAELIKQQRPGGLLTR